MENIKTKYALLRVRSFTILWFVYAGFYLTRKNLSVCKTTLIDQHGMTTAELGWIEGAYLAMYALGQFLNGMLGDRLGARVMLAIGMISSAAMSLLFGFVPAFFMLVLIWAMNGYMQSSGWANCVKSMTQWFATRERGVIMGFWCTCYQIGSFVAGFIATYCLDKWGLKSAFTIPALMLFVIAIVYILFHKDTPEQMGLPSAEQQYGDAKGKAAEKADQAESDRRAEIGLADASVIREVLSYPMVWLMGASYFCLKFIRYALLGWLPFYMTRELGFDPIKSGYLANLPEIAGFLGAISAGYVSDKLMQSRRAPVCAIMFLGLALACALQTQINHFGTIPMILGASVIFFMIYGPDSIMTGAAAMDFGSRRGAATAAGFINGFGSIGAAIQAPLLGYLAGIYGTQYFFHIFAPLAVVPFLLMLSQWNVKAKA
jgi:sugar phosphate permease